MDYNLYIQKLILLNNNDCVLFNGLRFILMGITSPAFSIIRKDFLPFFSSVFIVSISIVYILFSASVAVQRIALVPSKIKQLPFQSSYAQLLSNKKLFRLLHLLKHLPSNSLVLWRKNQNKTVYSLFKIKTSTALPG